MIRASQPLARDAIHRAALVLSELTQALDSEGIVDELERLPELRHLLAATAATVERLLKRNDCDQFDPADLLAALSLSGDGGGTSESDGSISVGDRVYFKSGSGQPPVSGRVTEVVGPRAHLLHP